MPTEDLSDDIATAAKEPSSVSADGVSVSSHSLSEMVEADKYLKQTDAAGKKHRGLRFTKLKPPGGD